jgi:hypothetical protein
MPATANTVPTIQYNQNNNSFTTQAGFGNYISADPFLTLLSPNYKYPFPSASTIILEARSVSFTPNALGTTTHIYKSPIYSDITALANYFADWGCSYTIQEGPVHSINVQAPWDTMTNEDFDISLYASDQWELIPQEGVRNIIHNGLIANPFTYPSTAGNFVQLPLPLQGVVQYAQQNNLGYLPTTGSSSLPSGSASIAPFLPYASLTLALLRAGVQGAPSYTQILKRTAVTDFNNVAGAFELEMDNQAREINNQGSVNFILSTPDMLASYPIPQDRAGKFMLPSYSKKLAVQGVDTTTYHVYAGWLVKPPILQFIGRNKVQITQEFIWDEWVGNLYYIDSNIEDFPLVNSVSATPDTLVP